MHPPCHFPHLIAVASPRLLRSLGHDSPFTHAGRTGGKQVASFLVDAYPEGSLADGAAGLVQTPPCEAITADLSDAALVAQLSAWQWEPEPMPCGVQHDPKAAAQAGGQASHALLGELVVWGGAATTACLVDII